jgi:hypothetical protein
MSGQISVRRGLAVLVAGAALTARYARRPAPLSPAWGA